MARNEAALTAVPTLQLRELREAAGLSRDDLASRAGMTSETILQIELHGREPRYWTAWKLAQALGVSMDSFAGADAPKAESVVVEVFPRRTVNRRSSASSAQTAQTSANIKSVKRNLLNWPLTSANEAA